MTLVESAELPRVRPTGRATPRLIGVGVRDPEHDAATLRWAGAEASATDAVVEVVHAYLPLRLDRCGLDSVTRARGDRFRDAQRVAARAAQRIRASNLDLHVETATVGGLAHDVLEEFSSVVDLLVIGDDIPGSGRSRAVCWHVQRYAACPTVAVPAGWTRGPGDGPVVLVADGPGLPAAALEFAADWAARHGSTLEVSWTWASLQPGRPPTPSSLARQQEALDGQLVAARAHTADVPIMARIELGADWLAQLTDAASLLVASADAASGVRTGGTVGCPLAVVPSRR